MENMNPIAPPPKLMQQWMEEAVNSPGYSETLAALACQWGADQELEACCEWLEDIGPVGVQLWGEDLRKDRRLEPQSLKQQAITALGRLKTGGLCGDSVAAEATIRRALEALDD